MSKLIYVNAGHGEGKIGGYDPGAIGPSGLREADITQDIADRLEHLLRAAGFRTDGKKTEYLMDAVNAANGSQADLFISIHCNSLSTKPQAHGTEVWYKNAGGKRLATLINQKVMAYVAGPLGEHLGPLPMANRGVKLGNFGVIRLTWMPSALIEVAFISNPTEEKLLMNKLFRQEVAEAMRDAVIAYFQ